MAKKYVPEGAFTACDKGSSPSTLRVSNNVKTTIYNVPMATEMDFLPFFNLKPMGLCSSPAKWTTGIACIPTVINKWQKPKEGVKINGNRMILEDSYCDCIFGGKINIFFDRPSAVVFGVGEGKMPSEYIKDGFDWLEEKNKESRESRDGFLPDWMKPVTGVKDWFDDLGSGLVEGAVNGVVGLGETVYQVAQDPVGTAEALSGMIKDGYNATTEGVGNAYDWATTEGNFGKAADGAWNWASDGQNWVDAGSAAVQGVQDGASWVAKNPRKIGTTVGEFIPDVAAAVYTVGGSTALSVGKVAVKEGLEVVVEKTVKEIGEEALEKGGKEALEAGAKRTAAETLEQLAKHEGGDIAKVIDGRKITKIGPDLPRRHIINFTDEIAVSRQVNGTEIFYKYHGKSNRLGRDFNYVTKRKYSSLSELKEDLALLDEWGVKVEYVTEFKPQKGTWIQEGTAAKQVSSDGKQVLNGGGYQGTINVKDLPKRTVIRTDRVKF